MKNVTIFILTGVCVFLLFLKFCTQPSNLEKTTIVSFDPDSLIQNKDSLLNEALLKIDSLKADKSVSSVTITKVITRWQIDTFLKTNTVVKIDTFIKDSIIQTLPVYYSSIVNDFLKLKTISSKDSTQIDLTIFDNVSFDVFQTCRWNGDCSLKIQTSNNNPYVQYKAASLVVDRRMLKRKYGFKWGATIGPYISSRGQIGLGLTIGPSFILNR